MSNNRLGFYEFFAGGGMARFGLGSEWRCLMANDICPKKASSYRKNFNPADEFILGDIANLTTTNLTGRPVLAWASFPCQDLSLAGNRNGLDAKRSGTFWPFWQLMESMANERRPIPIIVLENVVGALTSNKGRDLYAILDAIIGLDYRIGLLVLDAINFVPQSRARLFFIAVRRNQNIPSELILSGPNDLWHPKALRNAYAVLPENQKAPWVWWKLPLPQTKRANLEDLIEANPVGVKWHTMEETQYLLSLMSATHLEKVRKAQALGKRFIGTLYKRTRRNGEGKNVQRAEVRFDQISGCLRTSVGGSSRQTILVVNGETIKSRLLSTREAARLMGVPETYILPDNYNEAYHLMGDGLVVPVVAWIEKNILHPLALANRGMLEAA
jgi:DNA (cytosine-5)-methyltransferase 1